MWVLGKRLLKLGLSFAAATAFTLSPWHSALAQSYPSKPINVVVPFAAGGPTDVVARRLADTMGKIVGQPMIVENKAGAGGTDG